MIQVVEIFHTFDLRFEKANGRYQKITAVLWPFFLLKLQNANLKPINLQKFMRSMSSLLWSTRSLHGIRMFNWVKYLVGFLDTQPFCQGFQSHPIIKISAKIIQNTPVLPKSLTYIRPSFCHPRHSLMSYTLHSKIFTI